MLQICFISHSAQERLWQSAIHGNDVPGRLGALLAKQPHHSTGTVLGQDRLLRQCTLRVEVGQLRTQRFGVFVLFRCLRPVDEGSCTSRAIARRGRGETSSSQPRRLPVQLRSLAPEGRV